MLWLEGKCLTEQSPTPGAQLSALGKVNDARKVWDNRGIGRAAFSSTAARPEMTEPLILDRSHASQGTLGWWLCWESRPRQGSSTQGMCTGKYQARRCLKGGTVAWCYENIAAHFKLTGVWLDAPINLITGVSTSRFAPKVPQCWHWQF